MSATRPKLMILYDFDPEGDHVAETMRDEIASVSGLEVINMGERCRQPNNIFNKWRRSFHNLTYALRVQRKIGPEDYVLCWQQNLGIALCLYWRLFGAGRNRRLFITCTTSTPKRRRFPIRNILNLAFGSRNLKVLFANSKMDFEIFPATYSNLLDKDLKLIEFSSDLKPEWKGAPQSHANTSDYYLSSGRSNRKYDFFLEFFETHLDYNYRVICDNLSYETSVPNISIYRNVYGAEHYAMVRGARALLLDLQDKEASAGNTVFVQTMELGVPIIITRCKALEDYVIDGKNCLVIEDGDADQLKAALEAVRDEDFRARMSEFQKRDHAARFSTRKIARRYAEAILEHC